MTKRDDEFSTLKTVTHPLEVIDKFQLWKNRWRMRVRQLTSFVEKRLSKNDNLQQWKWLH